MNIVDWIARGRRTLALLSVAAASLSWAAAARGEFFGAIVRVEAATDRGVASWEERLPDVVPDKVLFKLQQVVPLVVPGVGVVGRVEDMIVELDGDPVVDLGFVVSAGNSPATFTITSSLVSFPALNSPQAFASAAVTLTDGDPVPVADGASMGVVAPRTGLYRAEYNGGTTFAELLGSQTLLGPGSISADADSGAIQAIPGLVNSIQSSFSFELSDDDLASGTSRFEVFIPEPTTALMVLTFLGATLSRRRI